MNMSYERESLNFTENYEPWDLHIHTNLCPKGSNEFVKKYKDNTVGFIDELITVLFRDGIKRVSMISFTDHNQISFEVYKEYQLRNLEVVLIPGIEIDCKVTGDINPKHFIFYLDCPSNKLENLSLKVNEYLKKTREGNYFYHISEVIEFFAKLDFDFIISPHALKQGKRAIDFNWDEEEYIKKTASMYMDQFFIFWESAGLSSIQKVIDYLNDFEIENKKSIISFSDSDNFNKLSSYLENPTQFFNSLPTFRGIAFVGTDATRIRIKPLPLNPSNNSNVIKKVIFEDNEIYFSKQLNSIIGGRGSGKSLLLDAIANNFGYELITDKRKEFVNKKNITIQNYNNDFISNGFALDYFNQSFVSELFNVDDFGEKLRLKFKESFKELNKYNLEKVETENKSKFISMLSQKIEMQDENVESILTSYQNFNTDGLSMKIYKSNKKTINSFTEIIDYEKEIIKIDKFFNNLPKQINKENQLDNLKKILILGITNEIHNFNVNTIFENYSTNIFIDNLYEIKTAKSEQTKKKSDIENQIINKILKLSIDSIFRNMLIQTILNISKGFKKYYSEFSAEDGSIENRFIFTNEIIVETPIEFLKRVFTKNIKSVYLDSMEFDDICNDFISGSSDILKNLKHDITLDLICKELVEFNLNYQKINNLYFNENNELLDIMNLSPGTQTNILMEYIVYKSTNKPLLIDQPEDNVDNKTIFNLLTKWFAKLKNERQVIIVTHDANIVINSDVNNVIISEQINNNEFKYTHGALEFGNIIEEASLILDGGKDAVKRRLKKYES